ncbi:MAG: hypothetical protein HOH74_08765, partial [Gemmatimonadetes bacterium]|nr:hypothetical protein [Gemmatimonadota bacterium]
PFQIPPARRYEEYVEQLITRRDKEKEEAAEKTRRSIRVFHAAEALRMRQGLLWKLLYPLYPMALLFDALGGWMLRDMPERDRRLTALYNRLQLGLPLTQQQQQWLATQDYRTHETIRFIREQHPGRLMLNPLLWTQAFTRASHEAQRRDVEIRGEDAELLRTFADDLRGNPRSIKRFINTYQLAKGIFAQLERENRDLPSLSSLAAWLVLLQNWPYEASKVYADLHGGSEVAVVLQQAGSDDELSQEFRSYVIRHTVLLSELPTSAGFEVAGCFSLVSPTAGPSQTLAGQ